MALSSQQVATLAENASRYNALKRITGLLAYDGRRFIQALEGEEMSLRLLMGRIEDDYRHTDIAFMQRQAVPSRLFGEWSMQARFVCSQQAFDDFRDLVRIAVSGLEEPSVIAAFLGFARLS